MDRDEFGRTVEMLQEVCRGLEEVQRVVGAWQGAYREYLRVEATMQVFTADERRAASEGLLKAQNDLMKL